MGDSKGRLRGLQREQKMWRRRCKGDDTESVLPHPRLLRNRSRVVGEDKIGFFNVKIKTH